MLIVEDDNAVRELSRRVLESAGYRVIEAANAEAAEDIFTSDVELLVTDVIMPGSSGPDLYRTLARRKPALKVLFTSGYTADMIAQHGRLHRTRRFFRSRLLRMRCVRKYGKSSTRETERALSAGG